MLKKVLLFIWITVTFSACFKDDILEKEENEHFYHSDYYLNEFPKFTMEVISKNRYRLGTSFGATYRVKINQDYFETLSQNWDGDIYINNVKILNDGNKVYTFNIGPGQTGDKYIKEYALALDGALLPRAEQIYTLDLIL